MSRSHVVITRRALLRSIALSAPLLVAACGAPAAPTPAKPAEAPKPAGAPAAAAPAQGTRPRLVYWVYQFLKSSDDARFEFGKKWAEQNNVDIELTLVPQKDFLTKVSAAIEAKATPDIVEILAVVLRGRGQLLDVTDIYKRLEQEQGGWVGSAPEFMQTADGKVHHILWGFSGNLMIARQDLLKDAGFTKPPATWVEFLDQAKKAQKPPQSYGWAQPLSNQTDSNVFEDVMKSYGARLADETGKKVVLGDFKKEVWEFLDYFDEVWKSGVLPPGVTTWDNTMNNSTYQAGKAVFATNPITINLWLADNNPELLAKTGTFPYPKGPRAHIWSVNYASRSIMKDTKYPDLAKKFLYDSMEPKKMEAEYGVSQYGPVLKDQVEFDIWSDPKKEFMKGLVELSLNGKPYGAPDVFNDAWAEQAATGNTTISKMLQRIVVDNWDRDKAFAEAIDVLQKIYAKYA